MFLARLCAACQLPPMPPSVYRRCLSGKASWTMRTLSQWSPVYQWKAVPQMYGEASLSSYAAWARW